MRFKVRIIAKIIIPTVTNQQYQILNIIDMHAHKFIGKGVGILIYKHKHADKLSHSFTSVYKCNHIKVKILLI